MNSREICQLATRKWSSLLPKIWTQGIVYQIKTKILRKHKAIELDLSHSPITNRCNVTKSGRYQYQVNRCNVTQNRKYQYWVYNELYNLALKEAWCEVRKQKRKEEPRKRNSESLCLLLFSYLRLSSKENLRLILSAFLKIAVLKIT